ncbi:MAG: hypothetical protein RMJ89_09725, partial [Flammeovirgaceae bacterium]|nr:hypothetical protein [Flammeovirgaceae bacterium]
MNRLFYLPLIFKVTLVVGLLLVASSFTWQDVEKTAEEYFNDGLNNMKKKDYLKAIGDFTHAISLNPQYAEAYYQRAIAKDLFGQQIGFFN